MYAYCISQVQTRHGYDSRQRVGAAHLTHNLSVLSGTILDD